jgi:hypothetical protein
MCPLCIATTALLLTGGTSASGLTALLLRQRASLTARRATAIRAERESAPEPSPRKASLNVPLERAPGSASRD